MRALFQSANSTEPLRKAQNCTFPASEYNASYFTYKEDIAVKCTLSFVLALILAASIFALAQDPTTTSPAAATAGQASAPSKIGLIDIRAAIVNTNEGQRDLLALQKKLEPRQAELQKANAEVEDLKKQLQTQGDKLNDGARDNLQRSIDQKTKTLQRNYQDYQEELQNEQNGIANRIGGKLMGVLDKYAKDNRFTVILNVSDAQNTVLWASNAANVTKAIVDLYNTQSGVPAPAPATAAPQPPAKAPVTSPRTAPKTPATPQPKPQGR